MKTLRFEIAIEAPRETVWHAMLDPDAYRVWTAEFTAGSYYDGSWEQGSVIRFLSPQGAGMSAIVEVNRRFEHISIRHLGEIPAGGHGEPVKSWEGEAFERYTFRQANRRTLLEITCDVTPQHEAPMSEMWHRALQRLKRLAESGA